MPAQGDGISPENLEKIRQIKLRQWIDGKELLDGGIEVLSCFVEDFKAFIQTFVCFYSCFESWKTKN